MTTDKFTFVPLEQKHFPLLTQWLNEPHVHNWWSKDIATKITLADVENKMGPRVSGAEKVQGYIIQLDEMPIGYIQMYDARKFPRDIYELSVLNKYLEGYRRISSIDIYIGEPRFVHRGYGSKIVQAFLYDIVQPQYDACLVDVDSTNPPSIRCFEKAGFDVITELELEQGPTVIVLLYVF